jgi:hypothetical protein
VSNRGPQVDWNRSPVDHTLGNGSIFQTYKMIVKIIMAISVTDIPTNKSG